MRIDAHRFSAVRLLGECATYPSPACTARHAALSLLADGERGASAASPGTAQPKTELAHAAQGCAGRLEAAALALAWHTGHSTARHVQLPLTG